MSDKPAADEPSDAVAAAEGTDTGNPVAGVTIDEDKAAAAVKGDDGPEGNRQTQLAPPS